MFYMHMYTTDCLTERLFEFSNDPKKKRDRQTVSGGGRESNTHTWTTDKTIVLYVKHAKIISMDTRDKV